MAKTKDELNAKEEVKATEESKIEIQTEEEDVELTEEELAKISAGYNRYYGQTIRPVCD